MADSGKGKGTGRRSALKKLAFGGAGVYFPILGQAVTPAMARATHLHPAGPGAPPPNPDWKPIFLDEHSPTLKTTTRSTSPASSFLVKLRTLRFSLITHQR
ncbi:MAG: hypothetical protein DMG22_14920 [Acidobacteria bacterium]|nr:MAG: hypothetical protein DMG22_14920 [Acidobacteriota bacterium]